MKNTVEVSQPLTINEFFNATDISDTHLEFLEAWRHSETTGVPFIGWAQVVDFETKKILHNYAKSYLNYVQGWIDNNEVYEGEWISDTESITHDVANILIR